MIVVLLGVVAAVTAIALLLMGVTMFVAWEDRQYAIRSGYRRPLRVRPRLGRHPGKRAQEV